MNRNLKLITLKNSNGVEVDIINFGCTITSLRVPNKEGDLVNVVVGLSSPEDYLKKEYQSKAIYLGATIGRYAGRISSGSFSIDGNKYNLQNENGVHLHGGKEGFDKKIWNIEDYKENKSVTFSYLSKDGEEGYPGNLKVKATFELLKSNSLKITYKAETDKATPVNLTTHPYFNLNGRGSILKHDLEILSDAYLEVDKHLVPSGKKIGSKNTRFDFNEKSKIGRKDFKGLDDAFVLREDKLRVATLFSEESGIKMQVFTNQLAMVVYTNPKFPELSFVDSAEYYDFPSICFEPQNYPDAPNQSSFPNSILKPGETYLNEIIYKFGVKS